MLDNFCAFILTHGRPDKQKTLNTLKTKNYTGPIVMLLDSSDRTRDEYLRLYDDDSQITIEIFDKDKYDTEEDFDPIDNDTRNKGAIVYARNECYNVAKKLGYSTFVQLDDDYYQMYNVIPNLPSNDRSERTYTQTKVTDISKLFEISVRFMLEADMDIFAWAQAGDYAGGVKDKKHNNALWRKAMNVLFCRTDRRVVFHGRLNEDVNTYTLSGSRGSKIFTYPLIKMMQPNTQAQDGGMTGVYQEDTDGILSTTKKSMHSVINMPSAVKLSRITNAGHGSGRIHHQVDKKAAYPLILSSEWKHQ